MGKNVCPQALLLFHILSKNLASEIIPKKNVIGKKVETDEIKLLF